MFGEYPFVNFNDYNLTWIIEKVKECVAAVEEMDAWKSKHQSEYEELKALYDQIITGKFPESIVQAFETWARKNFPELVSEMIANVFFGLTDDGYFVAYIPESWSDITFSTTGYDIAVAGYDYGHLTLSY